MAGVLGTYNLVPYHNAYHAFSVFQGCFALLSTAELAAHMTPFERFAMLVAALAHDAAHDGASNEFHVNVQSEQAFCYNVRPAPHRTVSLDMTATMLRSPPNAW